MEIPKQYLPIMPYLVIHHAKKFSIFMQSVFGATEQLIVPTDDNKIMHGELRINDAVVMFADSSEGWKEKPAAMYLCVDEVNDIYERALQHGATSLQKPDKREYGFSAGVQDPFGNQWFMVKH